MAWYMPVYGRIFIDKPVSAGLGVNGRLDLNVNRFDTTSTMECTRTQRALELRYVCLTGLCQSGVLYL